MSQKVCKWCGREYDSNSRSASGAGGWATCSESCRLNLQASVNAGETKENTPTSKSGCLLLILLVLGGYGMLNKGCDAISGKSASAQTEEVERDEPATEPAYTAPEEAGQDEEVEESEGESSSAATPEEPAEEQQANEEDRAAESVGVGNAEQQALTMLRTTSYRYSTKDIMNATGLSRSAVKRLRRSL